MAICSRLTKFLDEKKVRYVLIAHSPAYTAAEVAASAHVKGKELVKCVMINADGKHVMVVTTSNQRVNLQKLRQVLGVKEARLETEEEFRELFEDCDLGAMPPFGSLYGLPVVADETVYRDREIAFNCGDHTSIMRMDFEDFEKLVQPTRADIADLH